MKKLLIYIAGVITGIILTIVVLLFVAKSSTNLSDNGITMFPETGDYISGNQFEIFQVIEPGVALAYTEDRNYGVSSFTGPVVLFVNDEGKYYYDDEIIKIPSGKCIRQVGVYRYPTKSGFEKTVPVVKIYDKN